MRVKYWTFYAIWVWTLLAISLMFMHFTDKSAWGAPLAYTFLLVVHFSAYRYKRAKALNANLCVCGHPKDIHTVSGMSWAEAQERSQMGDTRYVNYHDGCQCLTYTPSIKWMTERKMA